MNQHAHKVTVEALLQQGLFLEAGVQAKKWLADEPDSLLAMQYQGLACLYAGNAVGAEASFRQALDVAPELARNRANLAIALLAQGNYTEGLPLYEARYGGVSAHDGVSFPGLDPARQWRGGTLGGQRLLVVREQGFGDQIQFIRFVPALRALGATRIIASVSPRLLPLFVTCDGLDLATADDVPAADYDLWCPLLSLPLCLGIEGPVQPPRLPYLHASEQQCQHWRQQIDGWVGNKRTLGIVWAGSPGNAIDARRSMSVANMLEMLRARGDRIALSLQMGDPGMEQLTQQCEAGIIPLLDMQKDLSDAAAIIARLDLVISVDTAIAHLAGALGKPVWLLLPAGPDWRWGLQGDHTDWYPTMRIFRQPVAGDWQSVIDAVKLALQA